PAAKRPAARSRSMPVTLATLASQAKASPSSCSSSARSPERRALATSPTSSTNQRKVPSTPRARSRSPKVASMPAWKLPSSVTPTSRHQSWRQVDHDGVTAAFAIADNAVMLLLRRRDVALLLGGYGLSALGDVLALVALTIRVHDLTGAGPAVAGLLLAGALPVIVLAPLAGMAVD